jgi:hemerythrin
MISWKDEYKIGIQKIDEQHKKLFEIADKIFLLIKDNMSVDKYDKIVELINELKDYTVYHFESEEAYMRSISYKYYPVHKKEHEDFIDKINNLDLNEIDNNQSGYLLGIMDYVVTWISKHILEKDKFIGKYAGQNAKS